MTLNEPIEIKLEPLTMKDKKGVFTLFNNEKVLQSYLEKPIVNEEQTTDFIKRITTNGSWAWKIVTPECINSLTGICSLHNHDEINKTIEIGGTLLPEFWGKGIMLKAFQTLIEKARNEFKIKKVIGKTLPNNQKAIRLVEKLGFEVLLANQQETVLVKELE